MRKKTLKIQIVILCLILSSITLYSADRRTNKSRLVIMTFNAEFLWDGVSPEEGVPQVNFPWKHSQTEAEEHMQRIAQVIIEHNPDIVNLCEVENLDALKTLNDKFLAGRNYKPYFIKGKDTYTGQDVCILTRIDPIGERIERNEVKGSSGSVSKGVSKHYIAKYSIKENNNTIKLAMIGLHLLSNPSSYQKLHKRQAQADAIRKMAVPLDQDEYKIIVLGDFNDYDGDSQYIDAEDSNPISNVLKTIRDLSPTTSNDDLINIAKLIPKNQRYTSWWDRDHSDDITPEDKFTSIDHILISKALESKITSASIPHNYNNAEVSDHFPVMVTLSLGSQDTGSTPVVTVTNIYIHSLLPNPEGDERQNEWIEIKNPSSQSVDLTGWKFKDRANTFWTLSGTIAANTILKIQRNGKQMALNNGGDTVYLLKGDGTVVDTVVYSKAEESEVIYPDR